MTVTNADDVTRKWDDVAREWNARQNQLCVCGHKRRVHAGVSQGNCNECLECACYSFVEASPPESVP